MKIDISAYNLDSVRRTARFLRAEGTRERQKIAEEMRADWIMSAATTPPTRGDSPLNRLRRAATSGRKLPLKDLQVVLSNDWWLVRALEEQDAAVELVAMEAKPPRRRRKEAK